MLAGLLGGLISSAGSLRGERISRDSTREQMRFQERMSNSAHQRQITDLRKAGLNPILSAKYGGSSTPSGAAYKGDTAIGEKAVNSAVKANRQKPELNLIHQQALTQGTQRDLYQQQIEQSASAADLNRATAEKTRAEIPNVAKTGFNLDLTGMTLKQNLSNLKQTERLIRNNANIAGSKDMLARLDWANAKLVGHTSKGGFLENATWTTMKMLSQVADEVSNWLNTNNLSLDGLNLNFPTLHNSKRTGASNPGRQGN